MSHITRQNSLPAFTSLAGIIALLPCSVLAQAASAQGGTVTGGSVTGGSVTGGSVTGSSVKGGDVKGGSVTGGTVTGGSVTGGSVKGGDVTGGTVKGGSVTGGTATAGTVTSGTVTPGTVGAGSATTTVGNREITATAEGSVSVNSDGAKATVSLGSHKIVVEKERLLLDGKERAKLPPAAVKIAIRSTKGRLTVQADGNEVLAANLGKE